MTAAPISGVSHLQLVVSDLPASQAWYETALGMRAFDGGGPGDDYVALFHKQAGLAIVLSMRHTDEPTLPRVPLDHVAFAVADGPTLQTWADHLTSVGVDHPGVIDELGKPSLQLLDPDGISVELVAPPGSW